MSAPSTTSDAQVLEMLRRQGPMGISELIDQSGVTATAVRQRLARLLDQGLIERAVQRAGRGRPSHKYTLSEKAQRAAGNNFADLAIVLWNEIRAVKDPEVRRGLLQRVSDSLAHSYRQQISGTTVEQRLASLQAVFGARRVALDFSVSPEVESAVVDHETAEGTAANEAVAGRSATLTVLDCPYPVLAEQDRSICAMERMLFAELLDSPVTLSACRLDGHACCQFQTN